MIQKRQLEEKKKFINWVIDYEYNKLGLQEPDDVIFLTAPFELVTKMRTKRNQNDGIDNDNNEYVCSQIRKLRESLFAKMNPLRRFVLKYIICM